MKLRFDKSKDAENIAKHGISLADADDLDWDTAQTRIDSRKDYGEIRFATLALRFGRLHCLVWTLRDGETRPISFRKANIRERKRYEKWL